MKERDQMLTCRAHVNFQPAVAAATTAIDQEAELCKQNFAARYHYWFKGDPTKRYHGAILYSAAERAAKPFYLNCDTSFAGWTAQYAINRWQQNHPGQVTGLG